MTQSQTIRKLQRQHWRALQRLYKRAYREGFDAGLTRAHGQGRRGRTIRADASVSGLVRRIERHFGLDRYGFEVRIVHASSGRRVPAADLLGKYRVDPKSGS
jgi:hypothetical protein